MLKVCKECGSKPKLLRYKATSFRPSVFDENWQVLNYHKIKARRIDLKCCSTHKKVAYNYKEGDQGGVSYTRYGRRAFSLLVKSWNSMQV